MRNKPLKGLLNKSPLKDIKKLKQTKKTTRSGTVATPGGLGTLPALVKNIWKGYGKTNKEIIKAGRQQPGKI